MNIIIIKYHNPEYESKCVESVQRHTDLTKHTLTIHDNYPQNENLGALWNRLIEESTDEVICLLNSDTEVEDGWARLQDGLTQGVGAIGPITDNCGTGQKMMTRSDEIREINDLSGFCYVFKKSVWKEVGKFPEDMPFYGQESIFNRKLQDMGYKLMVDRRVFIHHEKGASYKKSIERGETTNEEEYWGAFHYYNYLDRLKLLRESVNQDFKIIIIGGGRNNPFPLHRGLEQACDEFFGANALLLRDVQCIPELLDIFQPDLILNTETKYKEEVYDFLKKAKKQGIKTALYFNDMRCPVTEAVGSDPKMRGDLSMYYDNIFLCNESHRKCWEESCKVLTFYMPQGSIQHGKPPKGTKHHILHIGAEASGQYHENRNSIIKELRQNVEITSKNALLRDDRIQIQNDSYGDYYSSDYALAISMEIAKYTSDRLYTIVGAGGCAVCYKPERLEEVFQDKEHLLFFRTAQEAFKIVQRTTEEEREEIKLKAFKHGQKHHSYKMRLLNILTNIYTDDRTFWGDLNNLKKIGK
ncbi:MAG: glycosyltransferase [Candidatus Paceibacterota bacterium]|jgi:glycosyltransferase involved in cell wall biosynthesis